MSWVSFETLVLFTVCIASDGDYREIARTDITIANRMGIGEFGPIFDAEVKLDVNDVQRAMRKVSL